MTERRGTKTGGGISHGPVIQDFRSGLAVNREFASLLAACGLDDFGSLYAARGIETVKAVPGREVVRLALCHEGRSRSFFLKRHITGPGGRAGFSAGAASPGMEEFRQLLDFRKAGIATVTPAAGGERLQDDGRLASLVLTEDAAPFISLEEAIRRRSGLFSGSGGRRRKRLLLRRIADTARAMHRAGRCHCDFNATHLLFDPDARPEDIRPALFDLQRVRTRRLSRFRWWLKSMAEMGYTLEEPVFRRRDRLYLWLRYADRRWPRPLRALGFRIILSKIRRIERHTRRLLARREAASSPAAASAAPSSPAARRTAPVPVLAPADGKPVISETDNMIIVWVNRLAWRRPGPIINIAVQNAAAFSRAGRPVHLVVGGGPDTDTGTDLAEHYGLTGTKHLTVHRVPLWPGGSRYSFPVFFRAVRLIRQLAKNDEVAVFTRESGFLPFLCLLRRHPNIRGFLELHDFHADLSWRPSQGAHHLKERFLERRFIPRLDGLICITSAQRERYRECFPHIPSRAFSLGTEPVFSPETTERSASNEERRRRRTLIYVGSLHKEKGRDFLLAAVRRLKAHGIRICFWGGMPRAMPELRARADRLGVSDAVEFIPFRPLTELRTAIAEEASAGLVMLQDTYYNRYLTCPAKALDYLSHGLPVIGSDLPSVREVAGDAGLFTAPEDEDAFVAAALALLDDPDRYARAAAAARRRAMELQWRLRAEGIMDFIDFIRKTEQGKAKGRKNG
ncbi:MAG: hypothetical protein CSB33_03295 [Desulfobacterales bacterium]|nr:MAG: hypothetical protein CSB33_03295 [Desulfobacterales bacterium]